MAAGHATQQTIERAYEVWKVMHDEAKKRGMALTRHPTFDDGRVIIKTTSAFIRALNSERDWHLNKDEEDLIRRYLKASGNVVTLEKLAQYQFRIFIKEEWSNEMVVAQAPKSSDPITARAQKLTPHEAGEDLPPAPVQYKCSICGATYDSQNALNGHMGGKHPKKVKPKRPTDSSHPLGEQAVSIMRILERRETLHSRTGQMGRLINSIDPSINVACADSLRRLEDKGWVERQGNTRKTYRVILTEAGKQALQHLDKYRAAQYVVAPYLQQVGSVTGSRDKTAYRKIAEAVGISESRVGSGVQSLVDTGKVKVSHGAYNAVALIEWIGEREPVKRFEKAIQSVGVAIKPTTADGSEFVLSPETFRTVLKDRLEEVAASIDGATQWLEQLDLDRYFKSGELAQTKTRLDQAETKLELIAGLVSSVMDGKISPLKALAEIDEALKL